MSSINKALRVPTLPIQIWFETTSSYIWEVGDDHIRIMREKETKARRFDGRKYLDALLNVTTPQQLGDFVERFGCPVRKSHYPIRDYYQAYPGSKLVPPYAVRLYEFFEVQNQLREAMVLPTSELLSRGDVKAFVDTNTFDIKVERRKEVYYGTLIKDAEWESCYTVIVFERLLAGIKYGLCEYCGRPFEISSGHVRKYCPLPSTCGHAVAQQNYRNSHKKPKKRRQPR